MCLRIDKDKTALAKSNPQIVERYKIVIKWLDAAPFASPKIVSLYQHNFTWQKGFNEAKRSDEASYWESIIPDEVHYGIHVFLTKEEAQRELELIEKYVCYKLPNVLSYLVIPVKCNSDDLVAIGSYDAYQGWVENEAYTKVFVEELPA